MRPGGTALGSIAAVADDRTVRRRRLLIGAAAGVVSTACLRSLRTPTAWQTPGSTPPLEPLAARPEAGIWPQLVKAAPAKVQDAYRWAGVNEEPLRYIPCYCGCAGQGHQDNFDCYVAEKRDGGWLVLSDHALG